jgi:hypothetical protein
MNAELAELDGSFEIQRDLYLELNQYGVRYRYPGITAEKDDAKLAMAHLKTARAFLRTKLGLK